MKAGREHRVPLSARALAILEAMQAHRHVHDGFVFPGGKPGQPLSNMAFLMLLRRMGRGDLTTHGFRSSFRDWVAERTNFPSEVAELALAHAIRNPVEAAYRRGDMFEKRCRLMQQWATFCTTAPAQEPRPSICGAPRGGVQIVSVEFLGDERWRAKVVQQVYDLLVARVEQMRSALKLSQESDALLQEIKKTLHTQVRGPRGTFAWIGTEGSVREATSETLTVLQVLYERQTTTAFNQTDDEPPAYFVDAIQDFMIARNGKTPTRKVHSTARNAWRDDPGADSRIREEALSPSEGFHSPYRGRPEKYNPEVVLAFADAIGRAIGRSQISWTRGKGNLDHRDIPDHASRGVVLDVLVAAVEWAMCVAWQHAGPSGSKPPNVKAEGILRIVKTTRR
jgi:hypothetical protein